MNDKTYGVERNFPIDSPPERVVSLVPSMTETLFDLGVGTTVIGRTDFCVHPAGKVDSIPSVGGTKNPDVNRIIALKPDMVIVNQEENRKEDVLALEAANIPVWVTFPKTVQDVLNLLWDIMDLFDETAMSARVRLIESTFDWLQGISLANEEDLPRVFAPIWLDPLMTFNADTYIHDLLLICGGRNVFAERERRFPLGADLGTKSQYEKDDSRIKDADTRYPRITMDEVVKSQPDIILLPSEPYAFTEADIALFADLDVPAAHNKRIFLVDGSHLSWHGTRIAYAFDTIPALLTINGSS
ncbi:MAG: helical backbone metal receptor [Aggregatilineales bacterium]